MNLLSKVRGIWAHGDEEDEENDRDFDAEHDDYDTDYTPHSGSRSGSGAAGDYSGYDSDSGYMPSYSSGKYASSAYPEGRSYASSAANASSGASSNAPGASGGSNGAAQGNASSGTAGRLRSMNPTLRAREKNIYTIKPKRLDEATVAADCLKTGSAVIVNLEAVDRVTAVRIVDFMSGVCYGIDGAQGQAGNAMKLGDMIFLFTPAEFDICSDESDYSANHEHFFREMTDAQGAPSSAQAGAIGPAPQAQQTYQTQQNQQGQQAQHSAGSSFASSYNSPAERRAWER